MQNDKPRFIRRGGKIIPIGGKKLRGSEKYKKSAKEGAVISVGHSASRTALGLGKRKTAMAIGFSTAALGIGKNIKDVVNAESFGDWAKTVGSAMGGGFLAGTAYNIGAFGMGVRSYNKRSKLQNLNKIRQNKSKNNFTEVKKRNLGFGR